MSFEDFLCAILKYLPLKQITKLRSLTNGKYLYLVLSVHVFVSGFIFTYVSVSGFQLVI